VRSQRNAEEIIVSQRQDVETLALVWVPTHTFGVRIFVFARCAKVKTSPREYLYLTHVYYARVC